MKRKSFQKSRMSPSSTIRAIYGLLFSCNLLINIDHGTIPAATIKLKSDFGIDNIALGFLGSLVFMGLTLGRLTKHINEYFFLGSLLATPIFCYVKAKYILVGSLVLNALGLLLFTLPINFFAVQAFSRFLVGFCQVSTSLRSHSISF
jgi:hypothetical protein